MCLMVEIQLNGACQIGFGPLACALSPPVRRLDLTMEQPLGLDYSGARRQFLVEEVVEILLMPETFDRPRPTVQCNLPEQTQILHLDQPRSSPDQRCHTPGERNLPRKRALPPFVECNRRAPSHDGSVEPKQVLLLLVDGKMHTTVYGLEFVGNFKARAAVTSPSDPEA